jgi:hemin uptake protein HemP
METDAREKEPEEDPAQAEKDPAIRKFQTDELFGGSRRIIIRHQGQEYILLITRHDKLVLNRRD